jgi:hypothetical protein
MPSKRAIWESLEICREFHAHTVSLDKGYTQPHAESEAGSDGRNRRKRLPYYLRISSGSFANLL